MTRVSVIVHQLIPKSLHPVLSLKFATDYQLLTFVLSFLKVKICIGKKTTLLPNYMI